MCAHRGRQQPRHRGGAEGAGRFQPVRRCSSGQPSAGAAFVFATLLGAHAAQGVVLQVHEAEQRREGGVYLRHAAVEGLGHAAVGGVPLGRAARPMVQSTIGQDSPSHQMKLALLGAVS